MGDDYDLLDTMHNKVIPLLLEYFMNDEDEVKGILQYAGFKIVNDKWPIEVTHDGK